MEKAKKKQMDLLFRYTASSIACIFIKIT